MSSQPTKQAGVKSSSVLDHVGHTLLITGLSPTTTKAEVRRALEGVGVLHRSLTVCSPMGFASANVVRPQALEAARHLHGKQVRSTAQQCILFRSGTNWGVQGCSEHGGAGHVSLALCGMAVVLEWKCFPYIY